MTVLIGKMAGELATTSRVVDRIRISMKGTEGHSDRLNGGLGQGGQEMENVNQRRMMDPILPGPKQDRPPPVDLRGCRAAPILVAVCAGRVRRRSQDYLALARAALETADIDKGGRTHGDNDR